MNSVQLQYHLTTAQQLLEALDCPRALTVSIMLRYGHYDDVLNLSVNFDYLDSEAFFRSYQATKLLSKAEWLPSSFDKKARAISAFRAAELSCGEMNETMYAYLEGRFNFLPHFFAKINLVRRKIENVLGEFNYRWIYDCNFGPGSDISTSGGFTAAYNKLESPGTCTPRCSRYLSAYVENTLLCRTIPYNISTRRPDVGTTSGNRVTFVPKNSKTDRSIAVEPRWNIFFQKGVGNYLRKRLKLHSINLNSQEKNQLLAELGSRRGDYATIDLQSASDSLSRELIRFLLPSEWATLLDDLRSWTGTLNGERFIYEKWSSMGNGYTFELESLVFMAICSAFTDDISVYGDDLVVPTEHYHEIVELLNCLGFKTNKEKSFCAGPFRESCGSDFFQGYNVTPIYWKGKLDDKGTLRLVNQISRLAARCNDGYHRCSKFRRTHSDLVSGLPQYYQTRGPKSIATVVHDSFEFWNARKRWQWDGWHLKIFVPKAVRFRFKDFDAALGHVLLQPSSDGYTIRDRTRVGWLEVFVPSGFEDYGRWC